MLTPTRHINLRLPPTWAACSLPELRIIASAIISQAAAATSYRPFSSFDLKVQLFFSLANIEVLAPINPILPVEKQYYLCRQRPYALDEPTLPKWYKQARAWFSRTILGREDSFQLSLESIAQWLSPNDRGISPILPFLDNASKDRLLVFPFSSYRYHRRRFHGPGPLLDGFSWQRYRFAQDYMQFYVESSNRLIHLTQQGAKASPSDLSHAAHDVALARSMFLATIFCARVSFVDDATGLRKRDYHYTPNQHVDNAPSFRAFPDVDWQVILLWWQGTMHWLHDTYPKLFKSQAPSKKGAPATNPLEVYTRTTATLEKYLHLPASDIDQEPYTTILQALEDITRQNEELDKMNKRNKVKHRH